MTVVKKVFYGWWIVAAMFMCLFISYGARFYSFGVYFKPMIKDLNWTRTITASAMGFSTIVYGLCSPIIGRCVDKFGARIVIISGALLGGLGFILIYFIDSILQFYIVYSIIMSAGIAATSLAPTNTIIAKWFMQKRAYAMGIIQAGIGVGAFVMINLAQYLVSEYGWRMSFAITGVIVWIVVIPMTMLVVKNTPQEIGLLPDGKTPEQSSATSSKSRAIADSQHATWTVKTATRTLAFWMIALGFFSFLFTYMGLVVHLIPYVTDIGYGKTLAAFITSILIISSIPSKVIGGYFGDKIDKRYLLSGAMILMAMDIVILACVTGLQNVVLLYVFVIIIGGSYGVIMPLVSAITGTVFGSASFGLVYGGLLMFGTLGGGLGPIAGGWIYDVTHSYTSAFWGGAAILIIGALCFVFVQTAKPKVITVADKPISQAALD